MLYLLFAFALLLLAVFCFGPRMPINRTVQPVVLGDDLDAQLAASEVAAGDVWDYATKEIIWAGSPGDVTDYVVVYIHGWQATKAEVRPLPDAVAAELGANLYFTRMTGHGQGSKIGEGAGAPLADATFNDWYNDLAEAVAIGRRLGRKVILMGTSNGGGLILSGLEDDTIMDGVSGIVLASPLITVPKRLDRFFIPFPFTKQLAQLVKGPEHNWTDQVFSADHAKYWTTRSPIGSVVAVSAVVRAVGEVDLTASDLPLIVAYGPNDNIVSAPHIERLIANWKGPVESKAVPLSSDPDNHVIVGDILAPKQSPEVVAWAAEATKRLF